MPRFRDLHSQHKLNYKNVQILDLTLPTDLQITEAVDFVRRHAKNGKVFIHCALGCCRAPSIAAGYLSPPAMLIQAKKRSPLSAVPGRKLRCPKALPN